ncbi:MAG: hypothetical protein K6G12_05295 [Lachnospiraceae bacterium]|nr:hypothetical protein [Lachnospiraceae bacterium]
MIEKAVNDLYGGFDRLSHPEEARILLDSIFSCEDIEELYTGTRSSEINNHIILKELDDRYPVLLKRGNIADVLEAAQKRKKDKT